MDEDVPERVLSSLATCLKIKIENISYYLRDFSVEKNEVLNIVKDTIEECRSRSALIVDQDGITKNTFIDSILFELRKLYNFDEEVTLIELNGLFHTDEKIVLKDIIYQMGLQETIEEKSAKSFAENLEFVVQCLISNNKRNKRALVYILDEFDLLCSHRNQNLIYHLFEAARVKNLSVCVLCLTTDLETTELLEKRVKSRFSHQEILLLSSEKGNEKKGVASWLKLVKNLLSFDVKSFKRDAKEWHILEGLELNELCKTISLVPSHILAWNKHIEFLVENTTVKSVIKELHAFRSEPVFLQNFLDHLVYYIEFDSPALEPYHFKEVLKIITGRTPKDMLLDLSVTEMCLVISMKHHVKIYGNDPFNFTMVNKRYLKFVKQNPSVVAAVKHVDFIKAFEHLKYLKLITPVSVTAKTAMEYQLYNLELTLDTIDAAVKAYPGLPTAVEQWNNSIFN